MFLRVLLPTLFFCNIALAADTYRAEFKAEFEPASGLAKASIRIGQDSPFVSRIDLAAEASRYGDFSGDGSIERQKNRIVWMVPATGGTLRYTVKVDHGKGDAFDARMTDSWAIMRFDDLFPPARVRAVIGASSRSVLSLKGPAGWVFESRYGPVVDALEVVSSGRRFSRPTGWLAAGELGIRRELIKGHHFVLAGPENQGMRRLDTLAFLRWTFPRLLQVFPDFPERLLIVGAKDDMWRGGLSGPDSLYLHNDRPLISENATSTILHELVHVAAGQAPQREDWLVEGMAEYYSLEILRRSRGISQKRYDEAMQRLQRWVKRDKGRLQSPSKGANTARAVLLLRDLDMELKQHEAGSLDALVLELTESGVITGKHLLDLVEDNLGGQSSLLRKELEDYANRDS